MPDTPAEKREANEKIPKKGGLFDKYKWWIIGGLVLLAGLVFFFVNRSNSTASQTGTNAATGTQSGIDPTTGVPYALEYGEYGAGAYGGLGYGGGSGGGTTGPAGPAGTPGARGKPGARGPRGKPGGDDHHDKHHSK